MDTPKEVSYKVWHSEGGMLVNTSALEHDHPMHPYNQIKAQGLKPEDYGMAHPLVEIDGEEFGDKSRGELIAEILTLRKELDGAFRHMAMF